MTPEALAPSAISFQTSEFDEGEVGNVRDIDGQTDRSTTSTGAARAPRQHPRGRPPPISHATVGDVTAPEPPHNVWRTIEHVLDSRARTNRAEQLLYPLLAAVVVIVLGITVVLALLPTAALTTVSLAGVMASTAITGVRYRRTRRARSHPQPLPDNAERLRAAR